MNLNQNNQLQDLEIALRNNDLPAFIKTFDDRINEMKGDEKQELFSSLLSHLQAFISMDSPLAPICNRYFG